MYIVIPVWLFGPRKYRYHVNQEVCNYAPYGTCS